MVTNNEGVHMFGMTIRPRLYIFTDYISTLGMELQISDTIDNEHWTQDIDTAHHRYYQETNKKRRFFS